MMINGCPVVIVDERFLPLVGYPCRPGRAIVTRIFDGIHPYHLIRAEEACTVYGWVDAEDIEDL